jgi:hypothetical protein
MGMDYIETKFGVPAANAINNGEKLYSLLKQSIFPANEAVQND